MTDRADKLSYKHLKKKLSKQKKTNSIFQCMFYLFQIIKYRMYFTITFQIEIFYTNAKLDKCNISYRTISHYKLSSFRQHKKGQPIADRQIQKFTKYKKMGVIIHIPPLY